ncbi:MAG TPA: hypothetical protein VFE53_15025 [Mucilaginibacter sp.]|jgi:hypothetical protein|nr:hypothetical protein [Mucilaginibacter sp.]
MTTEDTRRLYKAVFNGFNDPDELAQVIDLASYQSLSIKEIQSIPELHRFFGGDEDGPYSEFLNKGMRSLRTGFYKICEQPFYNTEIFPPTFSANVYYFHPENDKIIKYQANIGPMTNIHAGYCALLGTIGYGIKEIPFIPVLNRFADEKKQIGTALDHYYVPKSNFFNALYREGEIFYVIESKFDSDSIVPPRAKSVTWSFISH